MDRTMSQSRGRRPRASRQTPSVREKRRGLMRDEFIDAAAHVFSSRGYHASSTKEIAEELGMSQSSIYYYFPSKDAALEEVCFRAVEGLVQKLQEIVAEKCSAEEKLRSAIENHFEPARHRPHLFMTFLTSRQYLQDGARRRVGKMTRRYEQLFESLLRQGVEAGELRNDLDCAAALQALLAGCNAAATISERRLNDDVDRYARSIADVFVRGTKAE